MEPQLPALKRTPIRWPNGLVTPVAPGTDWLAAARAARVSIPTGCLGGSCGACEISVNGETLRACISAVPPSDTPLTVEPWDDPAW
ncbi:MAG: 2Fe-2S iron-sulfur cluster-binding protein [Cyanobacteriota bacterium]|nr:2Fe-2S iron-sulfur cluster-binding protein [Cyanobacteriota bacterium]